MRPTTLSAVCCLAVVLSGLPAHAVSTSPWCASGKPVTLAGPNWESGAFLTELLRFVFEKGYGCQTETLPGNTVTFETALGNNDLQVVAEEWIGRSDAWNAAFKAGKVKAVGKPIVGATEGWYVPEYVVKGDVRRGIKPQAPGLASVFDLPRYKSVFRDDEEPAKGRFLNCPTGWTCEGVNSQKLKAYKLTDSYVNFRPGTGAALDAEIASAYQRGKPLVFYYWSPTPLMGKYRFAKLKEPAWNDACFKTLADKNHPRPCPSASPPALIQSGVSKAFHDADPALIGVLSKFNVPIALLNRSLADMADNKRDAKQASRLFLKSHPEVWKRWVPADVAARLSAALK
ncbi:ABC transporter substrate-binding protein [Crenobacter cavernae]|uniref:ABC transporter substrate-binding protein n=1 Tax=Crenobacter cavernae TaxID=2290923 RepID=A0A345Y746_9NEIS|nr:ABC transporter substrate-binding protein [Crenobacter cavernae]AXK39748.1 ABC transporter substrate-binding protein [Crenobacter cavernae]